MCESCQEKAMSAILAYFIASKKPFKSMKKLQTSRKDVLPLKTLVIPVVLVGTGLDVEIRIAKLLTKSED